MNPAAQAAPIFFNTAALAIFSMEVQGGDAEAAVEGLVRVADEAQREVVGGRSGRRARSVALEDHQRTAARPPVISPYRAFRLAKSSWQMVQPWYRRENQEGGPAAVVGQTPVSPGWRSQSRPACRRGIPGQGCVHPAQTLLQHGAAGAGGVDAQAVFAAGAEGGRALHAAFDEDVGGLHQIAVRSARAGPRR